MYLIQRHFFSLLIVLVLSSSGFCHSLLLSLEPLNDSILKIRGEFADGEPIVGADIFVYESESRKILKKTKLPRSGSVDAPLPKTPYYVTLIYDDEHKVTRKGVFLTKDKAETRKNILYIIMFLLVIAPGIIIYVYRLKKDK